jgi:hypothetical protein
MRTISYDELVYKIKKDTTYTINVVPKLLYDKSYLEILIFNKEKKGLGYHYTDDMIDVLEVLYYDNIINKNEILSCFVNTKIDSKEIYEKLYQYAVMYDYRKEHPIFPFKLHIETDFLKEKLKNAPSQFKVEDIEFEYDLNSFREKDYDELMLYYREPSNMNDFKSALLEDPIACVLGQEPDRRDDYPGFTQVWLLMYYLQIFIDDGLITNNHINKILSEVDITNIDWFIHVSDLLIEMLKINKFKWHRYTLDIDVKMLQNKVEGAFNTPITEEKGGICKDYFLNLYNILDSPLKFDKTPQQRHELDMFYREKYRKLYEAELKEKANIL